MKHLSKFISGPAGILELKVLWQANCDALAVMCHPHPLQGGTMHNKVVTMLAQAYEKKGISIVCFNYRGVGRSEGHYGDGYGEAEDLLAVWEWALTQRAVRHLHWAGFSFGTFVLLQALQSLEVTLASAVLVAPPVRHFDFNFPILPQPCLMIQAAEDCVVPIKVIAQWLNENESFVPTIKTFDAAGHFFHGRLIELRTAILDWLDENVCS